MSSKIYFQSSNGPSFRRTMVNTVTGLHHLIAPRHAERMAKKVFLTPAKLKKAPDAPQSVRETRLETSEGKVAVYRLGSGPTILLSHGWSGAGSQYFPLMDKIASLGFTAVTFDHVGHGKSEGRIASLPAFMAVTEAVLDTCEHVVGIISHSMGTVSSLESRHKVMESVPQLLIAPSLNYIEDMMATVQRSGYSMKLFQHVVDDIGAQYKIPFESIDPMQRLSQREVMTHIIHDKDDRFAKYEHSEKASAMRNVTLVTTTGRGHGRIMQCEEIMVLVERWLAS
ncbi:alpha/beta fold hydrolase [Thaumasiovibrio subtropicus]|uniref:alpha/beta fold hydrolase n=1 Tax=Thaumasiovibrio subtropicus TaxID=1891207 RepID=UPI000B34DB00|nr:alpha/beta hydrolase [Thaumasiovibrio subtropicus]